MNTNTYPFDNLPHTPRAVALGVFEGLHIGHRAVICRAAGLDGLTTAVFTVTGNLPKGKTAHLMTDARRDYFLERLGVEEFLTADFDVIRDLSPEEFVREVLCRRLQAQVVACGFNYRFGKGGAGDAEALCRLGEEYGITVITVPAVEVEGLPVSTTRIRGCLETGDMALANRLLGFPFTLDMEVTHGRHLGREWGTPTINQPLPTDFVRPRFGVYASAVVVNGRVTYGVTNIGVKPTVGADAPLAETWIPEFSGDLYGQSVRVMPVSFLRDEVPFSSIDKLKEQIHRDGEAAKVAVLGEKKDAPLQAVLFDFDDTLQDRAAAFFKYSEWFFDKYFPTLDSAEKARRQHQMGVEQRGGYVDYVAYFAKLIADWGWEDAPSPEYLTQECRYHFAASTTLYPEAEAVLLDCRRRGYRVGMITNGPSLLQNRKLDVSGLRPLLDVALVSGDEGVHKPTGELFLRAAAILGVAPAHCLYVGDHPVNDMQGALNGGMMPLYIHVSDEWGLPPTGVAAISHVRGLPAFLDKNFEKTEN